MTIRICTHPTRCAGMADAHSSMASQLADALATANRLTAQLAARDAEIARLQDALCGAIEGKEFYYQQFSELCKGAK